MNTNNRGFTLIELLIVISLLGFLSLTGLSLFQGSQRRSRDVRRRADLAQIAKALEMYANDYSSYPQADSGRIKGCTGTPETTCEWGGVWARGATYMQKLPKDPAGGLYCYEKAGKGYKLFAKQERTDDPGYDPHLSCAGSALGIYTYVLLSPNLTPTPTP